MTVEVALDRRPWLREGGSVVSPTGMVHLVAERDDRGWFRTACGVEVGTYQGWGKMARKLEAYPHCSPCSIYGVIPKNWAERWMA